MSLVPRFSADVQLNWLARYLPLLPHLDADARHSLVEVGSGARGIGSVLDVPFVGVEVGFSSTPRPPMRPIEYDGTRLPFAAAAFHTVLSMDTLEHVPAAQRADFIRELTRVAAVRVLLGFPADTPGVEIDRLLAGLIARVGNAEPEWLHEHDEHGLPRRADVEAVLDALEGWRWRALPTAGALPCLLLTLADVLPGVDTVIRPVLEADGAALERWIAGATFGPSFRRVYAIERVAPCVPWVDVRSPATLAAALVCPVCGASLAADGRSVACGACAAHFVEDARGVLALRIPASARLGVSFVLDPDWLHTSEWAIAVHNYLHAFAATDACVLWLRVDVHSLCTTEALELLQPMLEPFGTTPFAAIALSDDPAERPPHAIQVRLPAVGDMLADWTPARFAAARRDAIAAHSSEERRRA